MSLLDLFTNSKTICQAQPISKVTNFHVYLYFNLHLI